MLFIIFNLNAGFVMKLAIVNNNLGSGGAEKLIYDMALRLHMRGIDFLVVLLTSSGDVYGRKLQDIGVEVVYLNDSFKDIYSPLTIMKLAKVLKNVDVVHTHVFPAQYDVALLRLYFWVINKKVKLITTEHSTHNRRRNSNVFKPIERLVYNQFDKVICITDETLSSLSSWLGWSLNDKKFEVIHNGVDVELYRIADSLERSDLNLPPNNVVLLQVSRFSPEKDQATVIRALDLLPDNYVLLLVGEGPLEPSLRKLTNDLNLKHRVQFLGFRHDVPSLMKMSDIIIQSSNWEGFGLTAVEGMAAGKIVFGSNVPGLSGVINDERYLFDAGDEVKLAEMIADADLNKIDITQVKRAELFDVDIMLDKYMKIYMS